MRSSQPWRRLRMIRLGWKVRLVAHSQGSRPSPLPLAGPASEERRQGSAGARLGGERWAGAWGGNRSGSSWLDPSPREAAVPTFQLPQVVKLWQQHGGRQLLVLLLQAEQRLRRRRRQGVPPQQRSWGHRWRHGLRPEQAGKAEGLVREEHAAQGVYLRGKHAQHRGGLAGQHAAGLAQRGQHDWRAGLDGLSTGVSPAACRWGDGH